MKFVDELTIRARAGNGGNGVVRWLHLKGKEFSGPAGGNGGNGGDVYIRGVRDVNLLARYRGEKLFAAQRGNDGESSGKDGKQGSDLTIDLPVGSLVTNKETGEKYELLKEGQTNMLLKGGRGGAGNKVFKSSVNRSPTQSTLGVRGEEATVLIELRLIADIGLVGLPNAGKSTLLNALTGARAKTASYAFTTLDPNLGVLHGAVIADIPGLIEGASTGKGLGSKFLRHIARTRLVAHCVSLESSEPMADYKTVRAELEAFEGGVLAKKPEIIVLTKSDTRESSYISAVEKTFIKKRESRENVVVVSALDDTSIKKLQDRILYIV